MIVTLSRPIRQTKGLHHSSRGQHTRVRPRKRKPLPCLCPVRAIQNGWPPKSFNFKSAGSIASFPSLESFWSLSVRFSVRRRSPLVGLRCRAAGIPSAMTESVFIAPPRQSFAKVGEGELYTEWVYRAAPNRRMLELSFDSPCCFSGAWSLEFGCFNSSPNPQSPQINLPNSTLDLGKLPLIWGKNGLSHPQFNPPAILKSLEKPSEIRAKFERPAAHKPPQTKKLNRTVDLGCPTNSPRSGVSEERRQNPPGSSVHTLWETSCRSIPAHRTLAPASWSASVPWRSSVGVQASAGELPCCSSCPPRLRPGLRRHAKHDAAFPVPFFIQSYSKVFKAIQSNSKHFEEKKGFFFLSGPPAVSAIFYSTPDRNFSNPFQPVISCSNLLKGFGPPGGRGISVGLGGHSPVFY
jgi:hypothetical protein